MPRRRQFSTEQKVTILRRHLVDKVQVSDLCNEYKLVRAPEHGDREDRSMAIT